MTFICESNEDENPFWKYVLRFHEDAIFENLRINNMYAILKQIVI